ncbi:MAG: HAD-IA family hydrolase [Candidatus Micrarchaeota archaeon]
MPKLFIFDLDDTLAHLWIDWDVVKQEVLEYGLKEGLELDPKTHIALLANQVSDTLGRKKVVDGIFWKYEKECLDNSEYLIYAQAREILKELKKRGHKVGIASNNNVPLIQGIAEKAGFEVDAIRGRNVVQKAKPHPDMIFSLMDELGFGREDVVFIGDSFWDRGAGESAEVKTVIVKPGELDLRKVLTL